MPRFNGTAVEEQPVASKPRWAGTLVGVDEERQIVRRGSLLPISTDAEGGKHFDSDAGVLGAAKRAFLLPSEVYEGKVDPLSPEGVERSLEFASTFGPASVAAAAGERAIPGVAKAMAREAVPVPSMGELRAAASKGYDAVRDAGVDYHAKPVVDMSAEIQRALEADGILDTLAPKTFNVLSRLQAAPEGSVAPIAGVEAARRALGNARKDFANPTEQEAARRAVSGLDQFVGAAGPQTVGTGDGEAAARLLQEARANHAAAKRSEALQGVEREADVRAATTNSGQNLDNATRQRLASLLLNKKRIAGFDESERASIERVARGGTGANSARAFGNLLGGGGGLGMAISGALGAAGGAATLGPSGAAVGAMIPPALGAGAKKIAAGLTQRGLRAVDAQTRKRSPLFQEREAAAPMAAISPEKRSALLRLLLLEGMAGNPARNPLFEER